MLVTRPAAQAGALMARLSSLGAHAIALPTLEIQALAATPALERTLRAAAEADWLVFVSANAVRCLQAQLTALGLEWPAGKLAAVGPATAAALDAAGHPADLLPAGGFDSEALLAAAELTAPLSARVAIVRGVGGRELLAQELARRGARVMLVELYRRVRPQADARPILQAWRGHRRRASVVTSREGLSNLMAMAGADVAPLFAAPLVCPSARVAEAARDAGFQRVVVTAEPGDGAVATALIGLFEQPEQPDST